MSKLTALMGLLSILFTSSALKANSRLINGDPVQPGTYKEVVWISHTSSQGTSRCTATVVGPRVVITAAHCASHNGTIKFNVNGTEYSAKVTRSPLYMNGKDHDVAIALTSQDIQGIDPASIGGTAQVGKGITLLGYGCTNPTGNGQANGGNDGILRIGDTVIVSFQGYDMVSYDPPNGAALCYGDSGGPAFVMEGGKSYLLGINSKGNILNRSWNARLDSSDSTTFLNNFISDNGGVEICGVNKDCFNSTPPAPTCSLSSEPSNITLGQSLTLQMMVSGEATSAKIEGTSVTPNNGSLTITPSTVGNFTATASVTGPGGTNTCTSSYTVTGGQNPDPPSCTMTATPGLIELGQSVVVRILTAGDVDKAYIDGNQVSFPNGQLTVTPSTIGQHQSHGKVEGKGGQAFCKVTYSVEDSTPQEIPELTAVPTFCGMNTQGHPDIKEVCLTVLKNITDNRSQYMREALLITYTNTAKEVMPIIHRKMATSSREELTTYANLAVKEGQYMVLDSRKSVVTRGNNNIPVSIEGRSATGKYFIVESLTQP